MMRNKAILEKRVSSLEQAVLDLQRRISGARSVDWLEDVKGSISDEEAFLEALEVGRAYRESNDGVESSRVSL